ncbi:hypothetical protein, conserved [Trypanosoma brucei gambiense DAL972]|uniref:Uncharacterized protein n=1 Tax=Trypanosoma brucei gambiense (strain MHOM/CI/86/DAL972) TaxID=679716 RepID=D0A4F5_TRYB9|nr:hypothetical protein, conserved [Trypanosoma brucei gambiense DAL972]CBH16149.1 hypothetical protein, conserved [Trypanosoma brucei gambiense DAL972]|eukprot:XP_011778413.1 hypothetical protein, conserved [Trypanosoma brucei gambiense DAL972]
MAITVQLVLASTGHSLPMTVYQEETTPHTTCQLSSIPVLRSQKVFVSDLVLLIRNCRSASMTDCHPSSEGWKYIECFDYTSLRPLRPNEAIAEKQKLLVFTPLLLSEALLEQYSSTKEHSHRTKSKVDMEEERWLNLKQAIAALAVLLKLHQEQMERQMDLCVKKVNETAPRFHAAKEGISHALEKIKDIKVFNDPDFSLIALVDASEIETAVEQGEVKLQRALRYLKEAQTMAPSVLDAISKEVELGNSIQTTSAWHSYKTTEQADGCSAVSALMLEVKRRVDAVRMILTDITKIGRKQSACSRYCDAVHCHVVQKESNLHQLPKGLEVAQRLMERRIVMRRAIHRLLAPLEDEHRSLQQHLRQFAGDWGDCLPKDLFGAVAAPLPPLYPVDDDVAQKMDRHFFDLEKDATEEFLLSVGAASVGPSEPCAALERRLREVEGELRLCRAALKATSREKNKLHTGGERPK